MALNQVIVNGGTGLDLTADTVSENNLMAGATAHNAAGEPITGAVVTVPVDSELSEESANAIQNKAVAKAVKGGNSLSGSTGYTVTDSVEYPIVGLKVFGKSAQDGTPSPENPVEIVSVENPTVTVCGKNLYQGTKSSIKSSSGWYCILGGVDETTLAIEDYKLPYGEQLILSLVYEGSLYTTIKYKKDGKLTTLFDQFSLKLIKFTIPEDYDELFIFSRNGTTNNFEISDIQIELSSTATSYEPYTANTLTLPYTLNAIPVSSGGNVTIDGQEYIADYVDFERGVKVQNTGNITFDGSDDENWQPYSVEGTTNFTSFALVNFTENSAKNWGKSDLICNRFVSTDNANNDYYYKIKPTIMIFKDTYNNVLGITLPNSIASTVSELRAWLADNSVTVIYKLKTCIETPIPESEMQLYRQLQTYNGTTNISNDKGAGLSVEYCTNKALSSCVAPITTGLQKQIDDLKAAVLSLGGNV